LKVVDRRNRVREIPLSSVLNLKPRGRRAMSWERGWRMVIKKKKTNTYR
jgi:hypothetical protein